MAENTSPPPSPIDRAFLTADTEAGELVLVRHGQQQWPDPVTATMADWVDPPLSELGERQAEAVGRYLATGVVPAISAVYSSHLSRAHRTGQCIAGHHGHEVTVLEDLAEFQMFGQLPSDKRAVDVLGELTLDGIRERFVQQRRWDVYPYSESSLEFRRRVGSAIEGILARHPGETVVVACHGGVINAVVAEILGLEVDFVFRPSHASVHRFRFGRERRVVEALNDTAFLRSEDLLSY